MNVLVLEPFYGGSHKSFLDGWVAHSRHQFQILSLPAYKWKWRMRHASLTFARQLEASDFEIQAWDAIWCSDMLNLPEFLGLAPTALRDIPRIIYFHENQLTYPVRQQVQRDLHFAYTNFLSAIAADRIWFNSKFHQEEFFNALELYLPRFPDYTSIEEIAVLRSKSEVRYPGIEIPNQPARRLPGPLRICWNARWEHDKNPEDFFAALQQLRQQNVEFRLIVLGESFRSSPPRFASARGEFSANIEHWGFVESRTAYHRWLAFADVVVSTAHHEFFGIGVVEAIAAGCIPILPKRLAYPEVWNEVAGDQQVIPYDRIFYDGTAGDLCERLLHFAQIVDGEGTQALMKTLQQKARKFAWKSHAAQLDDALETASTR